jgi:myosin-crossreactive antigen
MKNNYVLLRQIEENLLNVKVKDYYRDDFFEIDWSNDVIGLFGER